MSEGSLSWTQALAVLADPATSAVMLVQCSIRWLTEERRDLRQQLDEMLLARLLTDPSFRVSRLLWHDVPHAHLTDHHAPEQLHCALTDWVARLAVCSTLVDAGPTSRLQTLRLIERETTAAGRPADGLALWNAGRWQVAAGSSHEMSAFFARPVNTTPILWTSVELTGPAEDLDPTYFL